MQIPRPEAAADAGELKLKEDPPLALKEDPPLALKEDAPLGLKEDPPLGLKDDSTTDTAASSGASAAQQTCPMCGTPLLPEAEMCVGCGFNLQAAEDGAAAPAKADEDDWEDRLTGEIPESKGARIARLVTRIGLVLVAVVLAGLTGWLATLMMAKSSSHGRIDALVASVVSDGGAAPQSATKLAEELQHLPSYLEGLASEADRAKQRNLNLGGLQFDDTGAHPKYRINFAANLYDVGAPNIPKELHVSWQRAAAVATLIANLPESCDTTPLMTARDSIGLPAAKRLIGKRTDLDWQIEKSCDPDETVREFAAFLLLERLGTDSNNSATLETLMQPNTVAEKRAALDKLKTELVGPK